MAPIAYVACAVCVLLLGGRANAAIISNCSYYSHQSISVENRLVKATFLPDLGARLVEFIYKPQNLNFLLPYREQKSTTNPLLSMTGAGIESNNGGILEFPADLESRAGRGRFVCKQQNLPCGGVSIKFYYPSDVNPVIERTVTLRDESTVLEVENTVHSIQSENGGAYTWRCMARPCGDFTWDDMLYIPCRDAKSDQPGIVLARKASEGSADYILAQPWWGVADANRRLVFGCAIGMDAKDVLLANKNKQVWDPFGHLLSGMPAMGLNMQFPPGQITYVLGAFPGLSGVSWLDKNLALELLPEAGSGRLTLRASLAVKVSKGKITLCQDDGIIGGCQVGSLSLKNARLGDVIEGSFKADAQGKYTASIVLPQWSYTVHLLPVMQSRE